jgi:hypothetical protein
VLRFLLILVPWLSFSSEAKAASIPQAGVDQAIRDGSGWLLEDMKPRLERVAGPEVGRTALTYYALLKSGVPRDRPEMKQMAEFLAQAYSIRTYDQSCLILALATDDPVAHAARIHWLAQQLTEHQNRAGDWGYPGGADLSNTQYAALGLWKAAQVGVRIHASVWQRLAERTMIYRVDGGAFGYGPQSRQGTASMTAAGAGTLAICEQQLRLANRLDFALADQIIPARLQAQAWLGAELREQVGASSWHYYYLYGLERLGALSGAEYFDRQNWYLLGANKLIEDQDSGGSWAKDDIKTSFALLFLARATSSVGRTVAFTGEEASKAADPNAFCQLQCDGSGPIQIGVGWWNRTELRKFEWPKERGLGPRVSMVEYLADGERIAIHLADATRPLGNHYFRIQHHFLRKGAKAIQAKFHLNLPPTARALPAVITSPPLQVLVEHSLPREMQSLPTLYGPRISLSGCKSWASSQAGKRDGLPAGDHSEDAATDQSLETAWVFRAKDDKRVLKLKPSLKAPTAAIQIHPPSAEWCKKAGLQAVGMMELRINGEHRFPLLMPKSGEAGVLDLPKSLVIRSLEIRILTLSEPSVEGQPPTGMGGIAEVEFYFGNQTATK